MFKLAILAIFFCFNVQADPGYNDPIQSGTCSSEGAKNSTGAVCTRGKWQILSAVRTQRNAAGKLETKRNKKDSNKKGSGDPYQDCLSAAASVGGSCSSNSDNASASEYNEGAAEEANVMNPQSKTKTAEACQRAANQAESASTTFSGLVETCEQAIRDCSNFCSAAGSLSLSEQQKKNIKAAREECSEGSSLLAKLESENAKVKSKREQAQKCVNDSTGGKGFEMPQMPQASDEGDSCEKNPNSSECQKLKQDCSNPEFASGNEVCKCLAGNCKKETPVTAQDFTRGGSQDDSRGFDNSGGANLGSDAETLANTSNGLNLPQAGSSAGGGGGGAGGANTPGLNYGDDESNLNTNINGSRGGVGAYSLQGAHSVAVGPGNGSYSQVGSWIPPKLKDVDAEKFRPQWGRKPTSAQDQGPVLDASVNIWSHFNKVHCSQKSTLNVSSSVTCR